MGEIVPFHKARRLRAAVNPPAGSAEILFFLGVRYVRHEDTADSSKKQNTERRAPGRARRKKRA